MSRTLLHLFLISLIGLTSLIPTYAQAEVIAESKIAGFTLRLERHEAERILVVTLANAVSASVFLVEGPNRLVVDLEGVSPPRLPLVTVKDDEVVKGIRLGVHPGKARIVIDVSGTVAPSYAWETSDRQLSVRFSLTSSPEAPSAPTIAPTALRSETAAPQPSKEPPATPTHTATSTNFVDSTGSASKSTTHEPPTPLAPPSPLLTTRINRSLPAPTPPQLEQQFSSPTVTGIRFIRNQQQLPALAIVLNERREFRLARLDSKTYRLTIPGVVFAASHVALPSYPPSDFLGFTHCIPKQRDDAIEVLIGVDRGARAEASVLDSTIQIAVTPLPSLGQTQSP